MTKKISRGVILQRRGLIQYIKTKELIEWLYVIQGINGQDDTQKLVRTSRFDDEFVYPEKLQDGDRERILKEVMGV